MPIAMLKVPSPPPVQGAAGRGLKLVYAQIVKISKFCDAEAHVQTSLHLAVFQAYQPAPLHGSTARLHCTAPLHGPSARPLCTAPLHGSTARLQCTAPLHGPSARPLCTAPLHGSTARLHCTALCQPFVPRWCWGVWCQSNPVSTVHTRTGDTDSASWPCLLTIIPSHHTTGESF
uniref:Uncharacterized protein n=1 Tax=Knipowitschia caucasica TaxID=637954 RepID=A0AAV2M4M1_KNICA